MGNYLNAPRTEKRVTTGESPQLEFATSEMQGWRISMEDAKLASADCPDTCFGVFDGHGGGEVSVFVERHFLEALQSNRNYQESRFELALQETFLRMDELIAAPEGQKELIRIQRNLPTDYKIATTNAESMAGCTAVVALLKGNRLYVANAGDSRCVLARRGQAVDMSRDHKPELPDELSRIKAAGGSVEDGRIMGNINLSRSIGDFEYKRAQDLPPERQMVTAFPELSTEDITEDTDFLVLACDGIWDILSSQECVDLVYQGLAEKKALDVVVNSLLDRCLAPDVSSMGGLGCDNMTCIVVKFKGN